KRAGVNPATPGRVGYAPADRAAAIQLWAPAYSILLSKKPAMRTLDLQIGETCTAFAGSRSIPYLGVAAHIGWIEKNRESVPKLFATYKAAADWITKNPDEASALI